MKKQLVITGSGWSTGNSPTKIKQITEHDFLKIRPVIDAIKEYPGEYNWTWNTDLELVKTEKGTTWKTAPKIYQMYENKVSHDIIDKFSRYVPNGIDKIISIKLQTIIEEELL